MDVYRCYKTYSAVLMKCGSRLLKSELFKLAPLYGARWQTQNFNLVYCIIDELH